ncbi:phosphonate metabolism protein/1,5-bisphosphokinase (PRPP-forming) PhnN [Sagittula sp. NFXS13]|uniref:phosphonate metabolism protein/1,5-bisphosphokinase (PRPP-forming) PhnN n=1 Tax=Sagittula sp. NFXS13 TaxID=2819095 RepID=UPI0032DE86BA
MSGRLIAIVGPSGVGKDSVMAGIVAASPKVGIVRRVITRAAEAGGEDFLAVTPQLFEQMRTEGAFCLTWAAHGLLYGIPEAARDQVAEGATLLVNLSRGVLPAAQKMFPGLLVLQLTAAPEVLARRLALRGRENAEEIKGRLARAEFAMPEGVAARRLHNDGSLDEAVAQALTLIHPESV